MARLAQALKECGSVALGYLSRNSALAMVIAVTVSTAAWAQEAPKDGQDMPAPAAPAAPAAPVPPDEQVTEPKISPADIVNAMLGVWEFSNADHDKVCHLTFRADPGVAGLKLDIEKSCAELFPSTKQIVGWSKDNYGSLRLLNARGNAVIELSEVETGLYDGFTPEEGRYILQNVATATPTHSADDMSGDWAVTRGNGKPVCGLTLMNSPAANSDALALKIKPGCDAAVLRFGPVGWRMDQGGLVIVSGRGDTWQFEESDNDAWQRVPESADPIVLMHQRKQ
jgi:hypothetical protein